MFLETVTIIEANTAIVLGINYGVKKSILKELNLKNTAYISVYARGKDYHQVIKGKLKNLGTYIKSLTSCEIKVFVDTAPIMEKPLAEMAGIGWQGKHTNLVSKRFGSWLFLGIILTNLKLKNSQKEKDNCGSCSSCLEICPTNAFSKAGVLDARKCISYLTIEHKGHINTKYRDKIGNRIFGCDDCLAVCPWNKFASKSNELSFKASKNINLLKLENLLSFSENDYRKFFSKSPLRRTGYNRFMRNTLIAAGNSLNSFYDISICKYLNNDSEIVRAMAVWSLYLVNRELFKIKRKELFHKEHDPYVLKEWQRPLVSEKNYDIM